MKKTAKKAAKKTKGKPVVVVEEVCEEKVPAEAEPPVTCGMCEDADRMIAATVEPILSVITSLRSDLTRIYKSVSGLKLNALADHLKCPTCGLFFGGTHAGGLLPMPEPWEGLCKWCAKKAQDEQC